MIDDSMMNHANRLPESKLKQPSMITFMHACIIILFLSCIHTYTTLLLITFMIINITDKRPPYSYNMDSHAPHRFDPPTIYHGKQVILTSEETEHDTIQPTINSSSLQQPCQNECHHEDRLADGLRDDLVDQKQLSRLVLPRIKVLVVGDPIVCSEIYTVLNRLDDSKKDDRPPLDPATNQPYFSVPDIGSLRTLNIDVTCVELSVQEMRQEQFKHVAMTHPDISFFQVIFIGVNARTGRILLDNYVPLFQYLTPLSPRISQTSQLFVAISILSLPLTNVVV